jgi:hypothetical protein
VSPASLPIRWGPPPPGIGTRLAAWLRGLTGAKPDTVERLPELPVALRRDPLAAPYLAAEEDRDDRRAGAAAMVAAEAAIGAAAWWTADLWAHRALWHFERAEQLLDAARTARRIGDLRVAGGDPASARRYYAEAISEARDLGAEREEGLAAMGMGRAEMELGNVTAARKLGAIAVDLLERCAAPADEVAAAREVRGTERAVAETPATEE